MKRFYTAVWAAVMILVLLCVNAAAGEALLAPAENEENLWGYADAAGEWIIAPQYSSGTDFYGDYAVVGIASGGLAVINTRGEIVLDGILGIDWVSSGHSDPHDRYWVYGRESDDEGYFRPLGCFDRQTGKTAELNPTEGYEFPFEIKTEDSLLPVYDSANPDRQVFYDPEKGELVFSSRPSSEEPDA